MTQSLRQQQEHYAAVSARLRGPSKVNTPVRIVERVKALKPVPKPIVLIPGQTMAFIAGVVAAEYDFTVLTLKSPLRFARHVRARHIAMYLAVKLADRSRCAIGRYFKRDHTTVVHALQKVRGRLAADADFAAEVGALATKVERLMKEARSNAPDGR